jgi:hypothetical protein
MQYRDEIVEEVRAVREANAARFNYDVRKICKDLQAREQEHPERLASLKPAEPKVPAISGH